MEAYSLDLRLRVLALVDEGELSRSEIAALLHVSTAWIRRLVQRRRAGAPPGPTPQRHGPRPTLTEAQRAALHEAVAARPDATLAELRDGLAAGVSCSTVWRALVQLGLTRKKSR